MARSCCYEFCARRAMQPAPGAGSDGGGARRSPGGSAGFQAPSARRSPRCSSRRRMPPSSCRRSGAGDEALSLIDDELERARAFGAPVALGHTLRAAGVVHGGRRGLEFLREAVSVLAATPAGLERARAHVDRARRCAGTTSAGWRARARHRPAARTALRGRAARTSAPTTSCRPPACACGPRTSKTATRSPRPNSESPATPRTA